MDSKTLSKVFWGLCVVFIASLVISWTQTSGAASTPANTFEVLQPPWTSHDIQCRCTCEGGDARKPTDQTFDLLGTGRSCESLNDVSCDRFGELKNCHEESVKASPRIKLLVDKVTLNN